MIVTGVCECTGAVGPLLGGGHGWLQGRYGLMADNLVSADVVLADGRSVVVSEMENEELFWALRGAGHNFGIVTGFEYRVFELDEGNRYWSWEVYVFDGERLGEVVGVMEGMREGGGVEMSHWGFVEKMGDVNDGNVCSCGSISGEKRPCLRDTDLFTDGHLSQRPTSILCRSSRTLLPISPRARSRSSHSKRHRLPLCLHRCHRSREHGRSLGKRVLTRDTNRALYD